MPPQGLTESLWEFSPRTGTVSWRSSDRTTVPTSVRTNFQLKVTLRGSKKVSPKGRLEAERLRDVASEKEAQEQRKLKADPARQCGMHLDGTLTLQTRRKFTSSEPSNQEQLRAEHTVLQNMWLLAQLRQPGRSLYKDLTRSDVLGSLETPAQPERISTTARRLMVSSCHSRVGRTVSRKSTRSEKMRTSCVVSVFSVLLQL